MRRWLLVVPLLSLGGCAFTNLTVTPPQQPIGSNLSGGKGRNVQVMLPFTDDRPVKERCGMQKNGWNMDTANVYCSADPAQWLADLLAGELRESGFNVLSPSQGGADAIRLEGHLLQFFVEPKLGVFTFSPEADVHVHLVASSSSGLIAERDFYVKGTETSLVGVESNFQSATTSAVRAVVKDMVGAVLALMDRYPDLAVRVAAVPAS
jgi:hypothetical protein